MDHWRDQFGRPKELGEIWILKKDRHVAVCHLQGHPLGCEAIVTIDREIHRTEVFRDSGRMVDVTHEWRTAFEAKGWAP